MSAPPALFFWPALPLLPEILLGVLLFWVGRGICSFSSFGNKELSVKKKKNIFVSSEYIELEFSVCP